MGSGPGASPVLREMRWWDVESLLPLERELFGPSAWTAEVFWSELAHEDTRWYVVALEKPGQDRSPGQGQDQDQMVDDDELRDGWRVAGYAGLLAPGPEADVQTVAVAPWAQGRGVGGVLIDALIDRARQSGASSLLLEVRADNAPAIGLYRRRGFERIAVRRRYYQPEDVDAWVMRLRPLKP